MATPKRGQSLSDRITDDGEGLPKEIRMPCLRMILLALKSGNKDRALAAVERAFRESAIRKKDMQEINEHSYLHLILSLRLANVLDSHGIETVHDVTAYTRHQLLNLSELSTRSVNVIERRLERYGFELFQMTRRVDETL